MNISLVLLSNMVQILKNLSIVFFLTLLFFVVAAVSPKNTFAQTPSCPETPWYAPSYCQFNNLVNNNTVPDNEIFGERYTQAQVFWIFHSLVTLLTGDEISECAGSNEGNAVGFLQCVGATAASVPSNKVNENTKFLVTSSPIIQLATFTDGLSATRPASGVNYLASRIDKIIPSANAQEGFGFSTLEPLQSLWASSRNAAYALMTVAIVFVSFMIMLRKRLSPQAVVTVQYAIPRIIVALLVITFSYAIAGFMIDLAFLIQGIVSALLYTSTDVLRGNVPDVSYVFGQINNPVQGMSAFAWLIIINLIVIGAVVTLIITAITGGVGAITSAPIIGVSIILTIIVLIIYFIALLRIFWIMLKAYVTVIAYVLALPFVGLLHVISSGNPIGSWIRGFVAQLSVFLTVNLTIMFAHLLTWSLTPAVAASTIGTWDIVNPYRFNLGRFTGSLQLPGFQGISAELLSVFIGLIIMLAVPGFVNSIKSLISTGRTSSGDWRGGLIGAGLIGGTVGGGMAAVTKGAQGMAGAGARDFLGAAFKATSFGRAYDAGMSAKPMGVDSSGGAAPRSNPSSRPPTK